MAFYYITVLFYALSCEVKWEKEIEIKGDFYYFSCGSWWVV